MAAHKKVRNVQRDGRVALSLLGDKTNANGLREYVVIYGNARVTKGGAVALLQRLARIYLGPNSDFPPAAMRNIQVTSLESRRPVSPVLAPGMHKAPNKGGETVQLRFGDYP